ncbi:hypothetical protein [Natrinema limicola]|uniref:Uncharacterized protein n=1 Tax=Natrinema limicola JCM 13563 TaxID=1230457 RepID=M0CFE3_9EURY|nr:hypothetical protein [Natrinema limicola]ELZ21976.1 hypothetical protein C476_06077 [Natrinema limicola JCM 13563]
MASGINLSGDQIALVFSGLLVALYYMQYKTQKKQAAIQRSHKDILKKQSDIQEDQTSIMRRQEEWMRLEHKPEISIRDWQIEDNTSNFIISNQGNGPASDLKIDIDLLPLYKKFEEMINDNDAIIHKEPENVPDRLLEVDPTQFVRRTGLSDHDQNSQTIYSGNEHKFRTSPLLLGVEDPDEPGKYLSISIGDLLNEYHSHGCEQIFYMFVLKYESVYESEQEMKLFGGYLDIEDVIEIDDLTLEDIIRETNVPSNPENAIKPDVRREIPFG